jgi:hypothetical protein
MQSGERRMKSNKFSFDSQGLVSQDGRIDIEDFERLKHAKLLSAVVKL